MELRQLRYFAAVAEELSFTKAALKIPLAQSALSAAIRALERDLGSELFHRTGHAVLLTESGRALLAESRRVFDAVDRAQDAVSLIETGVRGTVHVGILQSLAFSGLGRLLVDFRDRRPLVRVEPVVEPAGSAKLVQAVQHNQLDVAFAAMPGGYPDDLEAHALSRESLSLVLPGDHPLTGRQMIAVDDLDGSTFVDYPPGWGIRRSIDELFERRGLQRTVASEVADCRTAFELAVGGFGVAFVIPSAVPELAALGHATDPPLAFCVSIVSRRSPTPRAAVRAFVDVAREHFEPAPTKRPG